MRKQVFSFFSSSFRLHSIHVYVGCGVRLRSKADRAAATTIEVDWDAAATFAGCLCPHDSCWLAIVRGLRQGIVYGCKIRFPHALVMTFLFRNGSFVDKMRAVIKMTYTHAKNLGTFLLST